jgi:hypothetical protein
LGGAIGAPSIASAQAGPPFLTNDPGTPGNRHWEINIAWMQTLMRGLDSYQVPQIDINFGLGDYVQLTYEIPYVLQTSADAGSASGWSNAVTGAKWRFLDQGEGGWQASMFPQVQTGAPASAQRAGIAISGPRLLLPLEAAKRIGPIDVNAELGYLPARHGQSEQFLGLLAGRPVTRRLELDAEIYDDRVSRIARHDTTLDVGGRLTLNEHVLALFMAGRGLRGASDGRIEFIGYFGIQILIH